MAKSIAISDSVFNCRVGYFLTSFFFFPFFIFFFLLFEFFGFLIFSFIDFFFDFFKELCFSSFSISFSMSFRNFFDSSISFSAIQHPLYKFFKLSRFLNLINHSIGLPDILPP
ncbi:MAG: hypothetical protein DRM99_05270 [Thermoplasmata archaeon]|nr:MAG: hypothetical protein DRM99_05270 [Thermoplasmata archaeon]